MIMERLQGRRSTSTPVDWQLDTAFAQCAGLRVQLDAGRILDACDVLPLLFPHLLNAVVVQQRHAHGILTTVAVEAGDQAVDELRRLVGTSCHSATVKSKLFLGQTTQNFRIGKTCYTK